ncbi:MAG TPA: radical SAM protein [Syntrophomonadaceae bacterium]|nr:radical SAM protein [Syntrophomonadaceae bacterium]
MRYEGDIFSPHIAGEDYILQCTIGCSHNQCTFCGMYKTKAYRVRDLKEILEDIDQAQMHYGDIEKVFLADGDALTMSKEDLIIILDKLYKVFPGLNYVGTYATARSILNKTISELIELRNHGLIEAHLGVESGDREILQQIRKGVTYEEMVEAGRKLKKAGIELFATIILGLAGRTPKTVDHVTNTACICNDIQPDYLGVLTVIIEPRTELFTQYQNGNFQIPLNIEIVQEMHSLLKDLNLENCGFTSIHPSNPVYIEGMLPQDKDMLLETLTCIIEKRDISLLRPRAAERV